MDAQRRRSLGYPRVSKRFVPGVTTQRRCGQTIEWGPSDGGGWRMRALHNRTSHPCALCLHSARRVNSDYEQHLLREAQHVAKAPDRAASCAVHACPRVRCSLCVCGSSLSGGSFFSQASRMIQSVAPVVDEADVVSANGARKCSKISAARGRRTNIASLCILNSAPLDRGFVMHGTR